MAVNGWQTDCILTLTVPKCGKNAIKRGGGMRQLFIVFHVTLKSRIVHIIR